MKVIENKNYQAERSLYALKDAILNNISFKGEEDGESPLKEASNITINNSYFDLRYPLWHDINLKLFNVEFTKNSRAALWYDQNVLIDHSLLNGIKALREVNDVIITNSEISSDEFGWRSKNIVGENLNIVGEYLFFEAKNLKLKKINYTGHYSFQYNEDLLIEDSILNTKDAFWHAKNVIVKNSIINGEYLAWYSENITFINCKIKGTQPICYANNIRFINCEFIDSDLAFEYSIVYGDIFGEIISIKNPRAGELNIKGSVKELINTADSKYKNELKLIINGKEY